jgi:hypothetical protein
VELAAGATGRGDRAVPDPLLSLPSGKNQQRSYYFALWNRGLNPKCKYNDDQIRHAIALLHVGVSVREAVEQVGISKYTLYRVKNGVRGLTLRDGYLAG